MRLFVENGEKLKELKLTNQITKAYLFHRPLAINTKMNKPKKQKHKNCQERQLCSCTKMHTWRS